jgi:hypothetical protein
VRGTDEEVTSPRAPMPPLALEVLLPLAEPNQIPIGTLV